MSKKSAIVESDPQKLAAQWKRMASQHFAAYGKVRELCEARIQKYREADLEGDGPSAQEIRAIVQSLKDAIAGEREALSMQFHDHNVAIGAVQQLGFLVQRPEDGSIEVKSEYITDT